MPAADMKNHFQVLKERINSQEANTDAKLKVYDDFYT